MPDLSMQKAGLPVDKAQQITKEPVGLETPISDEEGIHRGDFIRDENAIMPLDIAIQASLRGAASKARSSLTPREERVLRIQFETGMNSDHMLEEVAQQFSIPRVRIRQIKAKALRTLQHPSRAKRLRTFLDGK